MFETTNVLKEFTCNELHKLENVKLMYGNDSRSKQNSLPYSQNQTI